MKWTPIPGFPGFEITRHGAVRSWWSTCTSSAAELERPRLLTPHWPKGYATVTMRTPEGDPRQVGVHRLLLTTFVRPPKPGERGVHVDNDKSNNALPNLAWKAPDPTGARKIGHDDRMYFRRRKAELARELARERGVSIASVYRIWRDG